MWPAKYQPDYHFSILYALMHLKRDSSAAASILDNTLFPIKIICVIAYDNLVTQYHISDTCLALYELALLKLSKWQVMLENKGLGYQKEVLRSFIFPVFF